MARDFTFPIRRRLVIISGFTQKRGDPHGLHNLYCEMRAAHVGVDSHVDLYRWCEDWKQVANDLAICGAQEVYIFAYSWGAGWGFTQLAKLLDDKGLKVRVAVLCDPVYRSRWISFRWRALLTWFWPPVIQIPANVQHVYWFRQFKRRPMAHELEAVNPKTRIESARVLERVHVEMDDAPEFHELALEIAATSSRKAQFFQQLRRAA